MQTMLCCVVTQNSWNSFWINSVAPTEHKCAPQEKMGYKFSEDGTQHEQIIY